MAEKKKLTEKETQKKMKDLKIELLKNNTKRKSIKKEIARLLTMVQQEKNMTAKNNKIKLAPEGVPIKGKENK